MNKKYILLLHLVLAVYSLLGIASKLAAGEEFLSKKYLFFYGIVLLNLFLYAICWQQILKKMSLVVAYANKAVTVIWAIVWGYVFWGEHVSPLKIVGAVIIIVGIYLMVTDKKTQQRRKGEKEFE